MGFNDLQMLYSFQVETYRRWLFFSNVMQLIPLLCLNFVCASAACLSVSSPSNLLYKTDVHVAQLSHTLAGGRVRLRVSSVALRDTCTLPRSPILVHQYDFGLSRTPVSPPWWRRGQDETFALPVVLSTDSSRQPLPLALRDDEQEWRAYLSRLGFNEVSAPPPPLIGNYLVHQEFGSCPKHTAQGLV